MWRASVCIAASSLTLAAQTPAGDAAGASTGSAAIQIRVVRAETGEPLRKALVSLIPSGYRPDTLKPAFTDDNGGLVLASVPPGRYRIDVGKAGFVMPRRISAQIDVADRATEAVEIRMLPGAAISGRIVDEFGDPVERASVSADIVGRTELGALSTTRAATATTDDRGEYRIGRLPPGTYVVSVVVPQASPGALVTVTDSGGTQLLVRNNAASVRNYYPGVRGLGQSQPFTLRAGDERSSIDMTAAIGARPLPTLSISFTDESGAPAVASFAVLHNVDSLLPGSVVHRLPDPRSTVALPVEPGEWALYAQNDAGIAGVARVVVDSSDVSLTVPLKQSGRISGRVITGASPLPPGAKVSIEAHLLDAGNGIGTGPGSTADAQADGTFRLTRMMGRRELRVGLPRGWALAAIRRDGRDLLGRPIDFKGGETLNDVEVVLTDRLGRVDGLVVDALRRPVPDASVLVLPDVSALTATPWLQRVAQPDLRGRFWIDDLLPGPYLIVALRDIDEFELGSVEDRSRIRARATPLVVTARKGNDVTIMLAEAR